MSTSVAYLTKRLHDIGRHDLLSAIDNGDLSAYAAAEAAGLITRSPAQGGGSGNQTRRRHYALLRATGQVPPLDPKPEPAPTRSEFSPATREIIARLVETGRTDLVLAVTERRLSPSAALRIFERRKRQHVTKTVTETPEPKKPVPFDPAALIG